MKRAKVLKPGISQRPTADTDPVLCNVGDVINVSDETWEWLGPNGSGQLGGPNAKLLENIALEVLEALDDPADAVADAPADGPADEGEV